MKYFFKKTAKYFLLVLTIWAIYLVSLLLLLNNKPKQYTLYYINTPLIKHSTRFILGNSMTQSAICDSILYGKYLNLSRSGEPLFYTTIKAQKLIDQVGADTLIIGFDNLAFNTADWVLSDNLMFEKYKKYFSSLTFDQHKILFKNNFPKAFKTLLALTPKDIENYKNIDGGFRYLRNTHLDSTEIESVNKTDLINHNHYSKNVQ